VTGAIENVAYHTAVGAHHAAGGVKVIAPLLQSRSGLASGRSTLLEQGVPRLRLQNRGSNR